MSTNLDAITGPFQPLRFGEVRPAGWIHAQMMQDLTDGFAGHLHELTDHAANDLFRNRIGTSTDEIQWWDSETRGNWMIGLTQMSYLANHPAAIELVEHALQPFKDYAVAAFHDYDIIPRELEDACVVPILDGTQPDWGCVFRRHAPVGVRPWDEPPVAIQLGEYSLVPIGCTVLRRSTLPLRSPGRAGVPAG